MNCAVLSSDGSPLMWDAEDLDIGLVHFSPCFSRISDTHVLTAVESQKVESSLVSQEETDIRGS